MTTPRFGFIEWLAGTTEPDVLHNTLALKTDIFLAGGVKSRTTSVEPGAPTAGDCYIIPDSSPVASGAAWSSFTPNYVAVYYDGAWTQYAPPGRFLTYVDDEALLICWTGSAYVQVTAPVTNKFDATAAPTPADDASLGYGEGSIWVDVTNDRAYICLSATATSPASAVWREIGDPVLHNMAASAPPAGTDSAADGYSVGSRWFDTTNDEIYFCIDDGSGSSPEVAIWKQVGSGTGGGMTAVFASGNYTASSNELVACLPTTAAAAFTITLPAAPAHGDKVYVYDFEDDAGTYNITVDPNGNTVDGDTSAVLNINGGKFELVAYISGSPETIDWKLAYSTPGASLSQSGTFTPTITDDSHSDGESQAYTTQSGSYTKIRGVVTFVLDVALSSLGTLTTTQGAYVDNLPFTAAALSPITVGFASGLALPSAGQVVTGYISSGQAYISLRNWDATTGVTALLLSELTASGRLVISGSYLTND